MKIALVAALLVAASPAQASELDRGVTRLVNELELTAVPGFGLSDHVAVAVLSEGTAGPSYSGVVGLLRARLIAVGVRSVTEIPSAKADAIDEEARSVGAEFLLLVRARTVEGKLLLAAELRGIDRGFWAPRAASAIYATAEETVDGAVLASIQTPPAQNEPELGDVLRFEGAPQRLAVLSDRVLALASCDVGLPGGQTLFVLTKRWLYAFLYSGTGYAKKAAALELYNLPRAPERVRDAFGVLSCASGQREVALGSSELLEGQRVRAKVQGSEIILGVTRTFAGWPLGEISPGKQALAHTDAGRARLRPAIEIEGGTTKTLETPLLALLFDRGRAVALTDRYRVVRYSAELDAPQSMGTSGAGLSLFDTPLELAVATSSSARDRDRLRLLSLDRKKERKSSVEIDGAVHATAVAKIGEQLIVIAAAHRDNKTELLALPLKGALR